MPQTIRLNGSNYVSDKTRAAFENALTESTADRPWADGNGNGHEHGNGHLGETPLPVVEVAPAVQSAEAPADAAPLLESLDRSLARSFEHQAQTVHVHEQYMAHQSDYATLVSQLLRQQAEVFAQGTANPQQAELTGKVLESLAHSLARFQDLEAETLSLHKQFLAQQAQYSQAHLELMQQSLSGARPADRPAHERPPSRPALPSGGNGHHHEVSNHSNGNGHGNGHGDGHHAAQEPARPPKQEKPVEPSAVPVAAQATPEPAVAQPKPSAPSPAPQPAVPAAEPAELTKSLLAIVSEKTGYPADMLDLSMDMEADLGIDSIKRVEIMGAVQERHPNLPKVEPQALAEMRTLGQIVEFLAAGPDSKKA